MAASSVNDTSGYGGAQLGGTLDMPPGISRHVSLAGDGMHLVGTADVAPGVSRRVSRSQTAISNWTGHPEHTVYSLYSPCQGTLDSIKRLMKGDLHIGCGCRQRGLSCSRFANPFKVSKFGRSRAIELLATRLEDNAQLQSAIWTLSGLRLACHCGPQQPCRADILISAYARAFPGAFDRSDSLSSSPSPSDQLNSFAGGTRVKRRFDS